ncbi:DUF2989 domain-containing protein [Thalassotalea ganghwensis]
MRTAYCAFVLLFIFIIGCDAKTSLSTICNENPELCQEFSEDTWCRLERTNVIHSRLANKIQPNEQHKFELLVNYENYRDCLAKSSLIEHSELKYKQTNRQSNLLKVNVKIEQLSEQTRYSKHPRLSYYHWSRNGDKQALDRLLAMEGTEALNNHESQVELASYYAKRDKDKTISLLFRSLELVTPATKINEEVFKAIANLLFDKQEYQQAYIWLKVSKLYRPEDPEISESTLDKGVEMYNLDVNFLNKVAEKTLSNIKEGKFTSPKP